MAREFFTNVDLNNNRLLEAVLTLENISSTSAPSPEAGRIIYDNGTIKYHNGSSWLSLGTAGGGVVDTRQVIAGAGLTGGGNLQADITLNVISANSDMTVGANDITINSAPKWTTGRTVTLTGDVTGVSTAFDGTAALSFVTAIGSGVIVDGDINASAGIAQSKISGLDTSTLLPKVSPTLTSGDLTLANATPTANNHAASKQYVDNMVAGLSWKDSVRVATTVAGTISTAFANGQTVDGVALVTGNRILLKNQAAPAENGIYTVNASGAPTRATDADAAAEVEGMAVFVTEGTTNSDTSWVCTTNAPITLGTTGLVIAQFGGGAAYTGGLGIKQTGNTFDVVSTSGDLTVQADDITIVSAPKWSTARTITLGTDLTGSVSIDGSANVTLNATLAAGAGGKRFATNVTAGATYAVTHNLNTADVVVQVYVISTGAQIELDVVRTSVNVVTLSASPSIPAGLRCVVLG